MGACPRRFHPHFAHITGICIGAGPRPASSAHFKMQAKGGQLSLSASVSALPIFPVRLQTSIFGADELNFRVRDGNGWTLIAINTDYLFFEKKSKQKKLQHFLLLTVLFNDKSLYSIWTPLSSPKNRGKGGDPCGNRTHVCGVRGRRLSRLTNGPSRRARYHAGTLKTEQCRIPHQASACIHLFKVKPSAD